jgi:twitching motility protein PilU
VEILLNTRNISELIEKGEISEMKEALEKSLAPGSQTFEQALFKLFMEGKITQDEALSNADSASNMLWLINQATAGELSLNGAPKPPPAKPADEKKDTLSGFTDFKINVNA